MKVQAIDGKVKFLNKGKTEYKVETLLNGSKSNWRQTFKSYSDAMEYIKSESQIERDCVKTNYLITEITTKTLGVF